MSSFAFSTSQSTDFADFVYLILDIASFFFLKHKKQRLSLSSKPVLSFEENITCI